jgi:hypothetical protein
MSLHNTKRTEESAFAYSVAGVKEPDHFMKIIKEKDYLPQVFEVSISMRLPNA